MSISPETLMAYADGELTPEERTAVERAMAQDPALEAEVERHVRLRREVAAAYDPLLQQPAPEALIAKIRSAELKRSEGEIVDLASMRARLSGALVGWRARDLLAIAAALVVGLLIGATLLGRGGPAAASLIVADAGGFSARGALDAALTDRIGGDPSNGDVAIGLSFQDGSGDYCRAFVVREGGAASGYACREDDAWRVRMMVAEAPPATDGFRQAGSALPGAVLAAIEDAIAGDPLDAADEAAARERGWRE